MYADRIRRDFKEGEVNEYLQTVSEEYKMYKSGFIRVNEINSFFSLIDNTSIINPDEILLFMDLRNLEKSDPAQEANAILAF